MGEASPIDDHVAAYNAHDVERLLDVFTTDVTVATVDGSVVLTGWPDLRRHSVWLFREHPDVRTAVASRLQVGEWVVDERSETRDGQVVSSAVAFHVDGHLIDRVVLIAPDDILDRMAEARVRLGWRGGTR